MADTTHSGPLPDSPAPESNSSHGLRIPLPAVMVGLGLLMGGAHTTAEASVPVDDSYTTLQDTVLSGQNVTANDTWGSNTYTTTVVTDVSHGTLSLQTNGVFTYTPAAGYVGTDTFTYKLTEGNLTYLPNGIAQVTISVVPPPPPPPPAAPLAVPGLGPAGIAGLSAAVALLGAQRRRRDKKK